ncbi:MAG: glycosyltransferase family 2 protein [candidate division FCPU426 bacterium]
MIRPELSVLLIAKDEAPRLAAFFGSLKGLGLRYEVLLLDSGSSDDTVAIAKSYGARVLKVPWQGFAETKNRGFKACKAPWILSLDADENPDKEMLSALGSELRRPHPAADAFSLNRLNYFLKKPVWRGGWHPDRQIRLFKKGAARFNQRLVHEGMVVEPGMRVGRLEGLLHHHSYPHLSGYLDRMNRYTTLQAEELFQKRGPRPAQAALRMLADPPLTFLKMYVMKAAYIEGKNGLFLSLLSSSSVFWKYAKYWHRSWEARGGKAGDPWILN